MSGARLLWLAVWLALASGLYFLADRALNPNRIGILGDAPSVTLQRGLDGHYRAEALINGVMVNVLVDTGATGVAISQRTAERLQLQSNQAIRTSTANGDTIAYMTRLQSVQLGGVKAHNVAAVIAPGLDGDVLLGMSFLARMDVRLFQGKMTITQLEE
ncbi:retroviral-like aspartic protease family protein [Methylobacillus flagellatus]|uniref:retropepsin-like aspartic protease family protein n=1 Tax=Methylobacillus flagellatus TaxID=405 RepID=UPI0028539F93|nr:retropepsin-like aspartic protease [Methylobacillus flagellatus]MDR5172542.1 retroviral-like aspartic protease family protein [Methylobacillus flagellatus]